MALTKAVIVKLDAPGAPPIPVMFNPPKYELSKTNQFAEIKIPGLATSVLQFVNGNAKSLSMELFFDTTDSGLDVRARTAAVANLTEPDPVSKAPSRLLLLWGSLAFPLFSDERAPDLRLLQHSGHAIAGHAQRRIQGERQPGNPTRRVAAGPGRTSHPPCHQDR